MHLCRFIAAILLTASVPAGWAQTTPPATRSGGTPETRRALIENPAINGLESHHSERWFKDRILKGWSLAGSAPQDYEFGLEFNGFGIAPKMFAQIRSKADAKGEGFGTEMQTISATDYRGQRVRFSALLRPTEVGRGAGLWFRVDAADGKVLAFDNMQSRPVVGTQNWKRYDVVLDVPENGQSIAFGILLVGKGKLGFDELRFEKVGKDVPTTDTALPTAPVNLELKQ